MNLVQAHIYNFKISGNINMLSLITSNNFNMLCFVKYITIHIIMLCNGFTMMFNFFSVNTFLSKK